MSQVWLITGSSRGFGKALAEAVLEAGHRLVATARQPAQLASLANRYGDRVKTVALDVTDAAAAQAAVQSAIDAFGRLDVVVNNAGYGNLATIEEGSDADFRAQMETNFFGTVNVTRAALPVLRRQRSGHIIQFSSIGGRIGVPGLASYQSAKWAVEGFSEVLAKEVGAFGIRVTLVEPGGFRTDWGGPSMMVHEPDANSEYGAVLAPMLNARKSYVGNETGDPAKAAQAILAIARAPQPPLRLLLGSDAVYLAEQQAAKMAEEDAKWRTLSLSTDFDLSPQAAEDRERMVRSVL
ncbi:SDR family NAD(P)-dependent oxidoreductase [Dyella solisilvae]|uniref:SDR family NAD(P)-dependent oxidoreductase n=1 Tax=Dyella solisilvae TaxID=1920168 RepID=A0A370K427_9GAMM|nr:oxidoreductase [Dyella solisilvae]RDI97399.1 SDR family NAD(P)-dependent oxidoreductase [Dyella solisilvae]